MKKGIFLSILLLAYFDPKLLPTYLFPFSLYGRDYAQLYLNRSGLGKLWRMYCFLELGEKRRRRLSVGEAFQRRSREEDLARNSQTTLIQV